MLELRGVPGGFSLTFTTSLGSEATLAFKDGGPRLVDCKSSIGTQSGGGSETNLSVKLSRGTFRALGSEPTIWGEAARSKLLEPEDWSHPSGVLLRSGNTLPVVAD